MTCLGLVVWGAVLAVAVLGIATGAVLYLWAQGYTVDILDRWGLIDAGCLSEDDRPRAVAYAALGQALRDVEAEL